jgi:hypothetical protein
MRLKVVLVFESRKVVCCCDTSNALLLAETDILTSLNKSSRSCKYTSSASK